MSLKTPFKTLAFTVIATMFIIPTAIAGCSAMKYFLIAENSSQEQLQEFVDYIHDGYAFDIIKISNNHYNAEALAENTCQMGFDIILDEYESLQIEQLGSPAGCGEFINDVTAKFQEDKDLPGTL